MTPRVTFVVPCYKLAHLLRDCVNSILAQSFTDFEILIMDDCSPDETPQVAQSIGDRRVIHVRNEQNLGHLRNYNKGIALSRGDYVWLISADDRLRSSRALERYVAVMDRHRNVGYVFCPGLELKFGVEGDCPEYSRHGERDRIFLRGRFLQRLLPCNGVLASSGMVRKSCYEALGAFPLDLPYAGDWYLWCLFAIHYEVAYFAEPMVNYRLHEASMTSELMKEKAAACAREDLAVLWRVSEKTRETGDKNLLKKCNDAIAREYAKQLVCGKYNCSQLLTLPDLHSSISEHAQDRSEAAWIRARAYAFAGDRLFYAREVNRAADLYARALVEDSSLLSAHVKASLLQAGSIGLALRRSALLLRRSIGRLC